MEFKDALFHDRKVRRKMSRREYAELTGFTQTKIGNMESGRKLKPGEFELIKPYIEDLLDEDASPPATTNAGRPAKPREPQGVAGRHPLLDDKSYAAQKQTVIDRHAEVMERCGGTAPPLGLPSQYRPDQSPPEDFVRWLDWCDKVELWLKRNGDTDVTLPDEAVGACDPDDLKAYAYVESPEDWEDVTKEVPEAATDVESPAPPPVETRAPVIDMVSRQEVQAVPRPDPLPEGNRYVTNGELQSFKRCRRKWYLGSYRRLGPQTEQIVGAAPLGTWVHAALARWYVPTGVPKGKPMDTLEELITRDQDRLEAANTDAADMKKFYAQCELARAMVEGYVEWVAETGADSGLEIIAPETRVHVDSMIPNPNGPPIRLLAKLDVRARRSLDGARVFIDHKTVGDLTGPASTVHMDEQMLHYHLIEFLGLVERGVEGERTDGAIYNMLRKVKRTATANPPFYRRVEVMHNQDTLRSYWMRVKGTIENILEVERRLDNGEDHREVAYPTPTKDCRWDCDYFAICPMFDDNSRVDDFMAAHYVEINPLKRYEPDQVGATG